MQPTGGTIRNMYRHRPAWAPPHQCYAAQITVKYAMRTCSGSKARTRMYSPLPLVQPPLSLAHPLLLPLPVPPPPMRTPPGRPLPPLHPPSPPAKCSRPSPHTTPV